MPDPEFQARLGRLEGLIEEIEGWPDARARTRTRELLQTVLGLHAAGLERMLALAGPAREAWLEDALVGSMLLLHGLHPLPLDVRVKRALELVRPHLASHGGNVELLGLDRGVVRLRLQGSCQGCPASALTLHHRIEEAIFEAAPDVAGIEVEGLNVPTAGASPGPCVGEGLG